MSKQIVNKTITDARSRTFNGNIFMLFCMNRY